MLKKLFKIQNYKLFLVNMILYGMAVAITTPFLVLYMTDNHGLTVTQFGIFMAAGAIGSFVVNTIVGRFSDQLSFDRKYLLLIAIVMEIITFSLFLVLNHTVILVIGYIIFFSLGAPGLPQLYASARESVNKNNSNDTRLKIFANTVLRSMFSFGFLFGPLIGSILIARYDFTGLFVGTVVIFMVVFVVTLFIKPTKVDREVSISQIDEKSAPSLISAPVLILPFVAIILLYVGQWGYLLNMPLYVTEVLGEDRGKVGVLASLCAGLEVPFMIGIGWIASKFETKHLLMFAGVLGGLFFMSIGLFQSFTVILVGQVVLAFFLAILLGLGISYFQDLLPDFPGYASTLFANGMVIGQLLGNLLGGLISDMFSVNTAFLFSSGLMFTSVLLFAFTKSQLRVGEI
ncbi:MFS transporter [Nosocomiicoccus ampullae]|uniref:MFS transporter n=1 Tax=Nosocomiicoccus ampullae TaxID=489910 RepID=UPI001C5DD7EC|nr:MFS transporter [Nosocomiicoccus ampullae]QYA48698.1 MFS transporter [Nosocomiicoccus ampullae]